MEPLTVILIFLFGLVGGGAGTAVVSSRRKRKRSSFLADLRQKTRVEDGVEVSIFDVYWDLGVSDFALEIMHKNRFLPNVPADIDLAHERIHDAVRAHGSYSAFVSDTLSAIQEFYDEHTIAGARRDVPQLTTSDRKSIQIAAVNTSSDSAGAIVPYRGYRPVTGSDLTDRVAARNGGVAILAESGDGMIVDLDSVGATQPIDFISGIFDGTFGYRVERWWELRQLRQLKLNLDERLKDFYQYYAILIQKKGFIDPVYDTARRWDLEVERIERLVRKAPWSAKPFAKVGEALTDNALYAAKALAGFSRINVDRALERIERHAAQRDFAMAGYLVYLNQHAFFAGRAQGYGEYVRRIETAAYRVQQEIRELHLKGVL